MQILRLAFVEQLVRADQISQCERRIVVRLVMPDLTLLNVRLVLLARLR